MRILEQHKREIAYAKFLGMEEVLDADLHTGDYKPTYGEIGFAKVYVSIPRRRYAEVERNGVMTPYLFTVVSEKDLGLTEQDLFFDGLTEEDDFDPFEADGVKIYKIIRVDKSVHHTTYNIEEL